MIVLVLAAWLLAAWPAFGMDESLTGLAQQSQGGFGQLDDVSVLVSPSFSTGPAVITPTPSGNAPVFGTGVPAHFRIPPRFDLGWDERFLYPQKETSP